MRSLYHVYAASGATVNKRLNRIIRDVKSERLNDFITSRGGSDDSQLVLPCAWKNNVSATERHQIILAMLSCTRSITVLSISLIESVTSFLRTPTPTPAHRW